MVLVRALSARLPDREWPRDPVSRRRTPPHPATLTLCPYLDCSASALRDGWRWATIQGEHPDHPLQPERNVVYVRGGMGSSQAHSQNTPAAR